MKSIFTEDKCNYVVYNNPQDAEIVYERFWERKKIFGITYRIKRFRQDSTIMDRRASKKTGF